MGCGHSTRRRVYPIQSTNNSESRTTSEGQHPSPPYRATVSTATQTPPLSPQEFEDNKSSDNESHELDKVILVQPAKLEKENDSEPEEVPRETLQEEIKKKKNGDGVKIVLTVPSVPADEDDGIETIELDSEEEKVEEKVEGSSIETEVQKGRDGDEPDGGGGDGEDKSEGTNKDVKDFKDEQPMVEAEDVQGKDISPIPIPDSKIYKETVAEIDAEMVDSKEKDKPSQVDKPDGQVIPESSKNAEEMSSQNSSGLDSSKPKQHEHDTDPTAKSSHPLKPLPNIDEGITVTKSEPRLPLLPPIGSKKINSLQSSDGAIKSHSATDLIHSTAARDGGKGVMERRKEREEMAPHPLSANLAMKAKKKRSTDTLRSTSGSSISKSKRSSGSRSTVSLTQKSKSRESLKSGPQSRLSATISKSSDNLINGTTKKLSISRESLKVASQVYSSAPPAKGSESHKRGDSSGNNYSKSKEALKDKERKSSEPQKLPGEKSEVAAPADGSNTKEEDSSGKKSKDGDKMKETATPPSSSVLEQTSKPEESLTEKEHDKEVTTAFIQSALVEGKCPSNETIQVSSKSDEGTRIDDGRQGGSAPKEEKGDEKSKQENVIKKETSDSIAGVADPKPENVENKEMSPPSKPADDSSTTTTEKSSEKTTSAPLENNSQHSSISEQTQRQQENPKTAVAVIVRPKDLKEMSAVTSDDATSRASSADFANKLEIDKKTGQSEQSIVEAVEKSTESHTKTAIKEETVVNVTTPT